MERRFGCQWPDTSAQLLEHLTRDSRGLGSNPSLVHFILFLPVTTEKMQWTGQCLLEEFSLVLKQFVGRGGGDSKSTGGFKLPQDIATQIYRYMFTHIPNDAHIVTLFQTFIYVTLNKYPPPLCIDLLPLLCISWGLMIDWIMQISVIESHCGQTVMSSLQTVFSITF